MSMSRMISDKVTLI